MATNLETRQLPLPTAIVNVLVTVGREALSGKIVNSIAGNACANVPGHPGSHEFADRRDIEN